MKKKRLYISMAFLIAAVMCFGITVNASDSVKVYVNDKVVPTEAKIIDGKVYVPVDVVEENLNSTVDWNKQNNIVTIKSKEENVSAIVNKVGPSVVGIIGKLKPSSQGYSSKGDNLVFGSGVIYRADGYIITNAHVVKDLETIVVVLSNSKAYTARLKAMDEKIDLAMIKIDKGGLTPATFGSISNVTVGEPVIAIGTPLSFSLRNSATKGIISGINRSADGEYRFIQSDAAINGGNSGGPLVNLKGEVIGINSVKFIGFGVEGLSFSIPADTVKYVIGHFEKYGKVRRPYLGAEFSEGVAAKYGLPSGNNGLTITNVEEGSPAENAGLIVDDILLAVNNVKLNTKVDFNEEMKKYLPGNTCELTVERNDTVFKIKVKFGESK
ncbi:MAG: trypsin-like peptidase domain-containing protein [Clostridia bacterium]|nr:trypsin-like peptidase domain-containing protein [Clostridia bacterium]